MEKSIKIIITILFTSLFLSSCGGKTNKKHKDDANFSVKTTEECKDNIRAYQFGREMQTYVELRAAGLSLEDGINEYSTGTGWDSPYNSTNDCVKRGFDDAASGRESPYNKEGKSWSSF